MRPGQAKPPAGVSLGRRLKALRLQKKMSYEECQIKGFGSPRTIKRREAGEGPFNTNIVRAMCDAYGASAEETNELVTIAYRFKDERILEDRTDLLPPHFGMYVDFESRAHELYMYHPEIVPGLLQTADYARAIYEALRPALTAQDVERYVSVRLGRQDVVFSSARTVRIEVVLGEGVLARKVGGADVAARQLDHLHGLVASGNVSVWVLPFASGAHAGVEGPFALLRGDPDVAYSESSAGAQLLYKRQQLVEREEIFRAVRGQSIPIGEYEP